MPIADTNRTGGAEMENRGLMRAGRFRFGAWLGYVAVVTILFSPRLVALLRYAASHDLHSHILLVPFIAAYLLYVRRGLLPTPGRPSIGAGAALLAVGGLAFSAGIAGPAGFRTNDQLVLVALAYVSFVAAGGFLFLGWRWMATAAFPLTFLGFMVPLPDAAVLWLEHASASASADAAALFFAIAGTPLLRHGTVFELPGIVLQVAQECSGIRSSWVLFITSLLASHLFLKSPWRRLALVAFVIPLGILRNGFRVFVIGMLCVQVGPHMIDSAIHHQGGPFFFALSLVPLFLLLWWLRRSDS